MNRLHHLSPHLAVLFLSCWAPEKAKQLLATTEAIQQDNLHPNHYHRQAVVRMGRCLNNESTALLAAGDDLPRTDASLGLGYDKMFGKGDARTFFPDWNPTGLRKKVRVPPFIGALQSGRFDWLAATTSASNRARRKHETIDDDRSGLLVRHRRRARPCRARRPAQMDDVAGQGVG